MNKIAKGRTVVVCDADKATLGILCNQFLKMGIDSDRLICSESIKETLDIARVLRPDAIFIDIHLHESGYSICSLLDIANNELSVPVILMAFPERGVGPLRGVAIRGRGFMTKPTQLLTLQNKLIKVFREVDLEKKLMLTESWLRNSLNMKTCQVVVNG